MEKVLFDPGYSSCLYGISDSIEFVYSAFHDSTLPLKQKKFQFSLLLPKLKIMLRKNTAFYLGCLLWACYISNVKNAEIEDNPCLDEEYNEEESIREPLYMIDFLKEKLNKETKFYLGKTYVAPLEYVKILETYIDFIKLNRGFANTKNTDEIILPKNIKTQSAKTLTEIKTQIDKALEAKDLLKLFNVYSLIL